MRSRTVLIVSAYLEALRRLGPERAWDLIGNGRQPADERAGRVWSYTKVRCVSQPGVQH